jgi:hypothetical protein
MAVLQERHRHDIHRAQGYFIQGTRWGMKRRQLGLLGLLFILVMFLALFLAVIGFYRMLTGQKPKPGQDMQLNI